MKHKISKALIFLMIGTTVLAGCGNNNKDNISASAVEENVGQIALSTDSQADDSRDTSAQEELSQDTADSDDNNNTNNNAGETVEEAGESDIQTAEETSGKVTDPAERESLLSSLVIMQDPSMYTYDNMLADNEILMKLYPDLMTEDSLTSTADGRQLIHYVVGNPDAPRQIFINGAIHGREYLTFQLVMKQMVVYLQHVEAGDSWNGTSYKDFWENVAIHVVPLVNPDGVSISQFGLDGVQTESVLQGIYDIAAQDGTEVTDYYLDRWKANAVGVDLNRNFDAYWETYADPVGHVSSDHYKGTAPGSEAESAALISLTNANNFLYTISYHTQGQLIYWCFDNMDPIYDISERWVSQLSAATGYYLESDFSTVDPAGYSDWGIYRCQIPSVTIEVALGESPYLSDQFQQVWNENINVWEITLSEAMNR